MTEFSFFGSVHRKPRNRKFLSAATCILFSLHTSLLITEADFPLDMDGDNQTVNHRERYTIPVTLSRPS